MRYGLLELISYSTYEGNFSESREDISLIMNSLIVIVSNLLLDGAELAGVSTGRLSSWIIEVDDKFLFILINI